MRLVPIKFVLALLVVVAGGGGDSGCGCAWEAYRYNNYFLNTHVLSTNAISFSCGGCVASD